MPSTDPVVDTVHRYYSLVDQGDVTGVVSLFGEHAVYHRPGYAPISGRAALNEFYSRQRIVDSGRHTVDKLVVSANHAAVEGSFRGVLKDGTDVDLRFADFFVLDDDLSFTARNTYFFSPLV